MNVYILVLLLMPFASTVTATETSVNPTSDVTIIFGIVPQQAASKLARKWGPLLARLSAKTGYTFKFSTAKDIPAFEKRLAAGEYDMAYMNPYHYTVFHRSPGYIALAKEKDKRIKGIIVVRKDASIKTLEELQGKTLSFPAPAAFAASVLPRATLKNRAISITPKYVSSHDSVYRTVAKGLYTAGGGVIRTLRNMAPEIRVQLKILWTTKAYTPHAIAAHPRLGKNVRLKVQKAMLELETNPQDKRLLSSLNFKGIEAAHNSEWDDVRALGIDLLGTLIHEKN